MTHFRRVSVLAGIAVASMSSAAPWAIGQFGSGPHDNTTVNYDIVVSGTNTIITSLDTVVLAQFNSTWVGDIRATLTHVDSGTSVHLFHFVLGDGPAAFGDSTNMVGNFFFVEGAAQSVEQAANGLGDAVSIPGGNYRPTSQANFNATTNGANTVNTDYSVFNGLALDATWRLTIQDRAGGDPFTLGHWEAHGTGDPVPEPATFAALGLGALALLRRRRAAKA